MICSSIGLLILSTFRFPFKRHHDILECDTLQQRKRLSRKLSRVINHVGGRDARLLDNNGYINKFSPVYGYFSRFHDRWIVDPSARQGPCHRTARIFVSRAASITTIMHVLIISSKHFQLDSKHNCKITATELKISMHEKYKFTSRRAEKISK